MLKKTKVLLFKAKIKAMIVSVLGAIGALIGSNAFAAMDPEVASTTQQMVFTMKDNVVGVISTNISNIVIVGVIIFSLGFVWRLSKRFMK
ncbi:MAG: hypothetical protein COU31_04105 [Candidatus Magasanikbacteria bacterium CG10_big_fil_rev_8_21_14_0_10_40_10]|uniref:Uncharacterized protein n=1 Tax=Candidatus Magasanikbacteria bacterium CG10_big_fil_rev_8_21_14_0_10_40_10 TaxID=1974648 RepID=A0A2M6W3F4_9BACT|nr:MAG: hypothetical protein COU31_04105 [Candidatus Magasanikbacteria bacterium CG10_big_fil_rev_8_21_14_0_10_40_10]